MYKNHHHVYLNSGNYQQLDTAEWLVDSVVISAKVNRLIVQSFSIPKTYFNISNTNNSIFINNVQRFIPVGNYGLQDFIDILNTIFKAVNASYSVTNVQDQAGKITITTTTVICVIKFDTLTTVLRNLNNVAIKPAQVYTLPGNASVDCGIINLSPVQDIICTIDCVNNQNST